MTPHSIDDIKKLAAATAGWRGWDLLQYKTRRASIAWDLAAVAEEHLTGKESVLDMGCGNGRLLAELAANLKRGIGVDVSKTRIAYARLSLPMKLRMRVHFTRASAHAVPVPDGVIHIVLNRHSPLFPEEINRVLAPGGIFVTQQVGNQDARAVRAAFEESRGALQQVPDEVALPGTEIALGAAGFRLLRRDEYDVPFVLGDPASLLFWLRKTGFAQGIDIERDGNTVLDILDRLGTPSGIVTNEHRDLLVMQKPA